MSTVQIPGGAGPAALPGAVAAAAMTAHPVRGATPPLPGDLPASVQPLADDVAQMLVPITL
ncbi:MAG: hypothetical protein ACREQ5_09040 [Candidatus Dormibacteria bacterium]